jgi:hypothetical protein
MYDLLALLSIAFNFLRSALRSALRRALRLEMLIEDAADGELVMAESMGVMRTKH